MLWADAGGLERQGVLSELGGCRSRAGPACPPQWVPAEETSSLILSEPRMLPCWATAPPAVQSPPSNWPKESTTTLVPLDDAGHQQPGETAAPPRYPRVLRTHLSPLLGFRMEGWGTGREGQGHQGFPTPWETPFRGPTEAQPSLLSLPQMDLCFPRAAGEHPGATPTAHRVCNQPATPTPCTAPFPPIAGPLSSCCLHVGQNVQPTGPANHLLAPMQGSVSSWPRGCERIIPSLSPGDTRKGRGPTPNLGAPREKGCLAQPGLRELRVLRPRDPLYPARVDTRPGHGPSLLVLLALTSVGPLPHLGLP